jgi:soluble lytic murein transglycosylase-like protein
MAMLRNGFSIRHERHEPRETVTRLYLSEGADNYIDVPTAEILNYEQIEMPGLPAPSAAADTLSGLVSAAGGRNDIDPDLINSVIRAESGFNPSAVSRKGATGLMQLMPQTAASLGVRNLLNPADNVDGGTRYLRDLLDRYHNDLQKALAAYNAGPQSVEQYKGVPPYRETRAYVTRIILDFNRKKIAQGAGNATSQRSKNTLPGSEGIKRSATQSSIANTAPHDSIIEIVK